jgi:hypothetical protein
MTKAQCGDSGAMDGAAIVFPLAEGLKNMETISGAAGPAGELEVSDAEGKSRLEKLQFFFIFCSGTEQPADLRGRREIGWDRLQ